MFDFELSTSQTPSQRGSGGGFGPVAPEGSVNSHDIMLPLLRPLTCWQVRGVVPREGQLFILSYIILESQRQERRGIWQARAPRLAPSRSPLQQLIASRS